MKIPAPSSSIPDVASFLSKIGRSTSEFSEAFPTWDALFTSTSKEMKAAGIDVKPRKYILYQVEQYKQHGDVKEIKLSPKKNGGERKFNQYIAKKKILDNIELAKTLKKYRKENNALLLKYKQLNKLHSQNGDVL